MIRALKALAPRCKLCERRTRKPDGYCYRHGPAGPHEYRATHLYTHEGEFLRCSMRGCEDEDHKMRAALGFDR